MSRVLKTGVDQITNHYGNNGHKGVDLVKFKSQLDYIIAHSAGKVIFCQTGRVNEKGSTGNRSYGNCVKIDHGNGWATLYAHLAFVSVALGDTVKAGDMLGRMGNSGNAYGAHLHFEVWHNGERVNPEPYLDSDFPTDEPELSVTDVAKEVISGKWGNGEDRKNRLEAAGYNYSMVQNEVNAILNGEVNVDLKPISVIAKEVMDGKWGNGAERKTQLTAAGYNYTLVQNEVNRLVAEANKPAKKSNEEVAKEVVRGEWGNGAERRQKLESAGYDYGTIQSLVNKLL